MEKAMKEPDFDKLTEIAARMEAFQEAGQWNKETFLQLYREAKEAAGDFTQALEMLLNHAQRSWVRGL